jgi:hypothetical protein
VIATLRGVDFGSPPKLNHGHHERVVEQAALAQIFEQSGIGLVERRDAILLPEHRAYPVMLPSPPVPPWLSQTLAMRPVGMKYIQMTETRPTPASTRRRSGSLLAPAVARD